MKNRPVGLKTVRDIALAEIDEKRANDGGHPVGAFIESEGNNLRFCSKQ